MCVDTFLRPHRMAAVSRFGLGIGLAALLVFSASGQEMTVAEEPPAGEARSAQGSEAGNDLGLQLRQDPGLADAARDYLDALLAEDYSRAGSYLTPDSRYQDFCIEAFGRDMVDLRGKKAILKFWKESAEAANTVEVRFEADQLFVAGPNVYFIGTAFVKNLGETWNVGADYVDFTFTQISHIRMEDNKVTYHADHVDYAKAFEQLKEYREKLGPWRSGDDAKKN